MELQKAIQALGKTGAEVYAKVCRVSAVDQDKKTCSLLPVDGTGELFNIPWSADVQGDGLILVPAAGSFVLVVFLDKHNAQICNVSELQKLYLKIGGLELRVDEAGFLFKKGDDSLKDLMVDLLAAIKEMVFTTNAGPTINLVNISQFEALETRFANLLKGV